MVAIQTNPQENDQVAAWRAKGNYSFPVLLLPYTPGVDVNQQDYAGTHYGVWLAPVNLLLNQEHKQVFRHVGAVASAIEAEIREMLGLPPFDTPAVAGGRDLRDEVRGHERPAGDAGRVLVKR